nr:MAG TPA: hypothetical protein [Caudoviricetes sp.]
MRISLRIHHNDKSTALCFALRGNQVHHVNLQCSYPLCVVVAGADLRLAMSRIGYSRTSALLLVMSASACAFTTTERALNAALWLYLSCADCSPDMTNH